MKEAIEPGHALEMRVEVVRRGQAPGGDHHDMWIDPKDPSHIVVGNDGGKQYVSNTNNNPASNPGLAGRIASFTVTFPEGQTIAEMAKIVEAHGGRITASASFRGLNNAY